MRPMRQKYVRASLLLVFIAGLYLSPAVAPARVGAESAAPSELDTLRAELKGIKIKLEGVQKELELIRPLLRQRPAQQTPPAVVTATVSLAGEPTLGHEDAPLTLIEFSDYQCPFCARFAQTVLPALKTEYIDTGKLRYVFRDFPLDRMHPHARKAAEAAHCAGEQGQFWAMHDVLFHNQKVFQVEHLKAYARSLNLDAAAFATCLEQGRYAAEVQKDVKEGTAAGVQGTPGFVLGKAQLDDTVVGMTIRGAQPLTVFRQAIDRLLGERER